MLFRSAGDFAGHAGYGLGELARLSSGTVGLSDNSYSITGAAPTVAAYDAALAATRQLPQGVTLARAEISPAEVKPYVWGATREGNNVTLTGFAPSDPVRAAIAQRAAAVFPGAQIANRMQIARGAPTNDFAAAASYGLAELGKLNGGAVSLSEGEVHCDTKELECWKHGSAFSLETGRPNTLPATQPVPVYVATVVDGTVHVSLEVAS